MQPSNLPPPGGRIPLLPRTRSRSFLAFPSLLAALALVWGWISPARADIIPPGCSGNGYGISLFVDKPVTRVGDTLSYTLLLSNQEFPACQAEQITASIVTPDGVNRPITLRRTTLNPGESDLYRDVATYVVRQQDITNLVVRAAGISGAQINQSIAGERSANYRDVATPVVEPCLNIQATCVGGVGEAGAITFSGTVRNCGTTPLVGVTVVNSVGGGTVLGPVDLAIGEERAFNGSFVPADPCAPATATLTAQGRDTIEPVRTLTASTQVTCQNTLTPGLAITAECGPQPSAPGQPLVFNGTVRNTGNVTLTNVVIVADKPAANTTVQTIARLAPGETANYTGSYPAPAACESTVAVVANSRTLCNAPVAANTAITCPIANTPAVAIVSACPTTAPAPGARLNYTGTISNPGNVALRNLRVFSERAPGSPVFTVATLAPGAAANFSGGFDTPSDACSVTDTLTVIGENTCGGPNVTNTVTRACPLLTTPGIQLTTQCPTTPVNAGQSLTYSGTVRNSGNVALKNVRVVADRPAPDTVVFSAESLAAGASANFTGTFPVGTDTCTVTYNLRAGAQDACSEAPVTAPAASTCPVVTAPRIQITSLCPPETTPAGGTLVYSGRIQNLGDVTLTNVVVTSDRPVANTTVFTAATLAPGAVADFTGSYPAPQDSCSVTDTLTVTARSRCSGVTLTERVTKTCPLSVGGTVDLTVNCPSSPGTPGANLTYSGTVRNPGTVTLTNVVVINDSAPETPVLRVATLAPGASANFNASVRVPTNVCSVTVAFTATATDRCGLGALRDTAAATCPVNNAPAIAVTHECPATQPTPGTTASLSGTVRNSGNVTLTNVVVVASGATVFGPVTLEPGQAANFTGTFAVPADTCSVATTVSASGSDYCSGQSVSNTSNRTCPVRTTPSLELGVSCPPEAVAAGGQLTYSGLVRNSGDVTLTEVVVNRAGSRVFGPITLAPGVTTNFTVRVTAPAGACSVTESWSATSRDRCTNAVVTDTDSTTCLLLTTPAVTITVNCPGGQLAPGGTARYTGTVRNAGDITLTGLIVAHAAAPETPVFQVATLAPGATANYTADVAVPNDICSLTATFVVSAANACSETRVSESAAATCPVASAPQIAVTHNCPPATGTPGQRMTFAGTVRNTGNVTLTNVLVASTLAGASPVFGPVSLAPGQAAEFSGSFNIPSDITTCTYRNNVIATGNNKCTGAAVTANSSTDCPVAYTPGILVASACPEQAVAPGQRLTYTGSVRNSGTVTLRNVRVVDSQTGDTVVFTTASLAPGASQNFTGSFIVPPDCCSVSHTLTVTAEDICASQPVSDTATATCPVLYSPALAVTKQCPTTPVEPGDPLTFTGTVSNPGNITLVDVTVVARVKDQTIPVVGPIALAPGQVVNFKASYEAPLDFCGNDELLATGYDICGDRETTASVVTRCPVMTMPMLVVAKHCPPTPVPKDGVYAYTGTVLNAGNVTLTNVTVVNSMPVAGTLVFGPVTLLPGVSRNFAASYEINAKCWEIVDTLTARGQDLCSGQFVTNTATAVCPILYTPNLELTKECLPENRYTGTVRNTGNIGLSNVVVIVQYASGPYRALGPIELAIGESATYGATQSRDYTVTATAVSICGDHEVMVRANCAGPITDTPPTITHVAADDGAVRLSWTAISGRTYRVQYSEHVTPAHWQNVPGDVTATGTSATKSDLVGAVQRRFYRVQLLP